MVQRGLQQAAKLTGEIDRHTGVDGPLLVEKTLSATYRKNPLVPDIRVDVQSFATIKPEADEILELHIVAGFS